MEDNSKNNEKKFNCENCNYHTNKPSEWIKHVNSKKHLRFGKKKETKCYKCEYSALNQWNLKLHILSQHSTKEERSKSKYYCEVCDLVFFSSLYKDKHTNGKIHKNIVLAYELQKKVNAEFNV